jgi:hypothetical protein
VPTTITDYLRSHLIAEGIGRLPRVAGDLPPIWANKANTPAPGEGGNPVEQGKDAVINLVHLDGIPTRRFDLARRRDMIEVRLRSFSWPRIEQLYALISFATIDKQDFMLGGLRVVEIEEWTMLGMTDATELSGGQTLYSGRCGLLIESYRASWALA